MNLTVNDFKLIDGIGDKTSNNIYEFIHKGEEMLIYEEEWEGKIGSIRVPMCQQGQMVHFKTDKWLFYRT